MHTANLPVDCSEPFEQLAGKDSDTQHPNSEHMESKEKGRKIPFADQQLHRPTQTEREPFAAQNGIKIPQKLSHKYEI